jgi:hypothetical protein
MITFNNAALLSYSHSPKFLGDNFVYSIEKNLTVRGTIADFYNTSGVSGVSSGIYALINLARVGDDIVLNGVNFGSGYITNINVDEGNWVRRGEYTADILILSTGNLYNMTGNYFTGLQNFTGLPLHLMNDFSENFSLDLDSSNNYSYEHSVSFGFENALAYGSADSLAKNIASGIIGKEVPFNLISGNVNFLSGKKYYEESFDVINKIFSFTERLDKNISGDSSNTDFSYSLRRDENGITEVTESVQIQANQDPKFTTVKNKLAELKPNCYQRSQNFYLNYVTGSLNNFPITQGYNVDRFNGTIELETVYTDNPFIENRYDWSIETSIDLGDTYLINCTANLSIQGDGVPNTDRKYNNAIYGYNQKESLLLSKINSLYSRFLSINTNRCSSGGILNKSNETFTSSKYNGTVQYSVSYINKTINNNPNGIEEEKESISEKYPVNIYTDYYINNSIVRQQHDQKTFYEVTINKNRKYGKNVNLVSFPEDMRISTSAIKQDESLSINPMDRSATYNVTTIT